MLTGYRLMYAPVARGTAEDQLVGRGPVMLQPWTCTREGGRGRKGRKGGKQRKGRRGRKVINSHGLFTPYARVIAGRVSRNTTEAPSLPFTHLHR